MDLKPENLKRWEAAHPTMEQLKEQLAKAQAEIFNAKAELALTIDLDKESILCGIQRLSTLLHESKAENARLRGLLEPTQELLQWLADGPQGSTGSDMVYYCRLADCDAVDKALANLRAAREERYEHGR